MKFSCHRTGSWQPIDMGVGILVTDCNTQPSVDERLVSMPIIGELLFFGAIGILGTIPAGIAFGLALGSGHAGVAIGIGAVVTIYWVGGGWYILRRG